MRKKSWNELSYWGQEMLGALSHAQEALCLGCGRWRHVKDIDESPLYGDYAMPWGFVVEQMYEVTYEACCETNSRHLLLQRSRLPQLWTQWKTDSYG